MDRLNTLLRRLPTWPVWLAGVLPLVWLIWAAVAGGLGVDPVKEIEKSLGLWALQFLLASLCVTPLRWAGLNLIRFRRALGVTAFLYAALHFAAWLGLDMALRWEEVGRDLVKRPYIIVGMVGLLAMIPLALTSTDSAIRRLGGAKWRKLHRLAYVAGLAGALHYTILVKSWPLEPLIYLGAVTAVLLARVLRPRLRAFRAAT